MTLNAIQAPIQILDERTDDAWSAGHITDRIVQHVWGLRYIDDLMLNRQDTNADGDYVDSGDFTHYALTDHQFSVIAVIDSAANLIERVSYTPYGEARHHWKQDVDGDGDIDSNDQNLVNNASGSSIYQSGYNVDADFDRNGVVDSNDSRQIGSGSFRGALPAGWISSSGNVIGFSGYVFNREIDAGGLYTVRFRHYDPVWGRWISRDPAGYRDSMSMYGYGRGGPISMLDPFGLWSWKEFGKSLWDTARSIGNTYKDLFTGNWGNIHTHYDYGPFGQAEELGGGWEVGTKVAIGVSAVAVVAALAVGIVEVAFLGNSSILVEGSIVGGRMGSGGLLQLRPAGRPPIIRFDWHPLRPGGPALPHIDSPPLGWHHWPWSLFGAALIVTPLFDSDAAAAEDQGGPVPVIAQEGVSSPVAPPASSHPDGDSNSSSPGQTGAGGCP